MLNLFSRAGLSAFFAFLSLGAINHSLQAWESCDSCATNRAYIGAYGGGIYAESIGAIQMGTAFFLEAQGGPLAVQAEGHLKKTDTGFGGVQLGYELSQNPIYLGCSGWSLAPAAEVEAYFFSQNKKGHLTNPTDRLDEHDFLDSFQMNMAVCMVNAVFSVNGPSGFSPYIGGGIGASYVLLRNAKSIQVAPAEVGVNHFNSKRSDSTWAFAAQAKAGLRYKFSGSFSVFGEYRYLFVDASNYIFGSTDFPGHAATSPWNFKIKDHSYNAFAFGVQFDL